MSRLRAARIAVVLALLGSGSQAFGASFNVTASDTAAKTLNPTSATPQTGTVGTAGDLNLAGSTVAVTATTSGSGIGTATINNSGKIRQTGTGRAIRNSSGAVSLNITNNAGALIQAAEADAMQLSVAGTVVTFNNSGSVIVTPNSTLGGNQAVDWNGITTGSNTLNNLTGGLLQATAADAVRPGVNGVISNAGTIQAIPVADTSVAPPTTSPTSSDGIDAQNNSGVSVTNSGLVSGRHGITGGTASSTTFNISVTNQAGGTLNGVNGSGINIDSFTNATTHATIGLGNATVINNGTITGNFDSTHYNTGDGDGVDVDGICTLTNNGIIRALGAGSLDGSNNPEGVSIGGGSVTNNANAEITGQDTTGSGTKGHGVLVDDSNGGNALGGTTVTNAGLIRGYDSYAIKIVNTAFANSITNNATGTIRGGGTAVEGAAIQTGDGVDTLTNRGAITGDNGLAIDLGAGDDVMHIIGGGASIAGDVSGGAGSNSLDIDPAGSFAYAGALSNFAGVEIKSGTVTLSGASTYIGNTTVTAGTLIAANTSGSATGTGIVDIKPGATLGGAGSVGAVTAESGAVIAPGASRGTLTVGGDLSITGGSKFTFELGAPADRVNVTGTLAFTGGGAAVLDIVDSGIVAGTNYTLISFSAASGVSASSITLGSTPAGLNVALEITANAVILHTAAEISVSPTALSFAASTIGTASTAQSVTVSNPGPVPLNVSTLTIGGSQAGDYAITANTCGSAIAQNGSCSISIVFTPGAAGSRSASLSIASNAATSPSVVALSGTGIALNYSLLASPTFVDFGNQPIGSTSAGQAVTLTNNGNVAIAVAGFISGGSNPADFSTLADSCTGQTLAVNASCSVSFAFTPAASGSRSASRTVASSPAQTAGAISFVLAGVGTQPSASLSPASLSFGPQTVATTSGAQTITLSNVGNSSLSIASISASGDFVQVNSCGVLLAASASCAIDVSFAPTATGPRAGALNVISSAPSSPDFASLSGIGIQAALGTSGPLTFGPHTVGATVGPQYLTVTNTGTAPLNVGTPSLAGIYASDFSIYANNCGSGIAPGATCTIGIYFTPAATGLRSASLQIPSNAPDSPASVTVSGTGVAVGAKPGKLGLSSASVSAKESVGSATFKVLRTGGSDGAVSIAYATADGTAIAGQDYVAAAGTLTWDDGDFAPKLITVTVIDDLQVEDRETFTMTLSAPTGGAAVSRAVSTARITSDDKPGSLSFTASSVSVNENADSVTVSVRRTSGAGDSVGVHYATADGTALAGADYTATSGDLSWAAGDLTNKSFTIPVTWDTLSEKSELYSVVLSAPTGGAKLGSPKTLRVKIINVNH